MWHLRGGGRRVGRLSSKLRISAAIALASSILFGSPFAAAASDPLTGILSAPGGSGLGLATRMESSPYREGGTRNDLVPLYLYEGEYAYLHAYRAGLKLYNEDGNRFNVFLAHRFEGFPYDKTPSSLAGMAERGPGADFGMSYQRNSPWGCRLRRIFS